MNYTIELEREFLDIDNDLMFSAIKACKSVCRKVPVAKVTIGMDVLDPQDRIEFLVETKRELHNFKEACDILQQFEFELLKVQPVDIAVILDFNEFTVMD